MKEPTHPFPWQMIVFAAAACAGLTFGAYAIGVRPMLEQRERETTQRTDLQDRRQTASDLASTVSQLQRDLSAAKEVLARTPVRLQPATMVNQRLAAIARVASDCGVQLDEMRPGTGVESTHYQTVPIRIVGTGPYPACALFLRNLRKTFGDMGVRTFTATNLGAPGPDPSGAFQSELVWYTELPSRK